jgi:adenylate cyclase
MKIRQISERARSIVKFGGGAVVAVWIALLFLFGIFEIPELLTYDWRFHIRGEREPFEDILIITIDEASKKALKQRTPWKRSLHAQMIRTLMKHNPRLIVYDVIFQTESAAEEDEALANAIYDAYNEEQEIGLVILAQYISRELEQPLETFADNAGGLGVINLYEDRDNIVRSVPVVFLAGGDEGTSPQYHLCLSLETAALYHGGYNTIDLSRSDTLVLSKAQDGNTQEIARVSGPTRKLYINYIGGRYAYPMLKFSDILQGTYRPEDIEGKVIFIGDTSLTSHDYYLTPFQTPSRKYVKELQETTLAGGKLTKVPTFGIEIHAHAFQTILENSYIHKMNPLWSVCVILFIGSLSGILLFEDRGFFINTLILTVSGGFVWGVSQYLFNTRNLWIDLAPLEIVIIVNYVVGLGFQRAIALYNRNQVKGAFQQYVSTAVVEEMLKHPEKLQLGGERKFLTVLFSDIRGFTSISERMESQELVEFLNAYLTEMTEIVLKYDGTLDKYMGDAIMAIYGAPIEQNNHAARACSSALDMMTQLRNLQSKWRKQGKPVIDIGIGINSGTMTAGNMGSEKRFDYTVMGDNVNLGSRLEGINKQYGTNIIISEYTYQEIQDTFVVRELDQVRVKGKKEPVTIYELAGRIGQVDANTVHRIEHFEQGLIAYRSLCWEEAIEKFNHVLDLDSEDAPAKIYIERCQAYQQEPPPENWDGVYTMTTK